MAVLETIELPGSESMRDWALTLGSGTFEAEREGVNDEVTAGRARRGLAVGRTRAAPVRPRHMSERAREAGGRKNGNSL